MSSPYPVLGNRPIDQWKVTELKEELKRRKLTTKGLKDDLVRRLDEALRSEQEIDDLNKDNGFDSGLGSDNFSNQESTEVHAPEKAQNSINNTTLETNEDIQPQLANEQELNSSFVSDIAKDTINPGESITQKVDGNMLNVDINDNQGSIGEGKVKEGEVVDGSESVGLEGNQVAQDTATEISDLVTENMAPVKTLSGEDLQNNVNKNESLDLNAQLENNESKSIQVDAEDNKMDTNNQVSVVNPVLGFQVKSDSFSTDSYSINEKNELKDNIIADDVKLELDVKPEMMQPSSSNVVPESNKSWPLDVEEPHTNKISAEELSGNNAQNVDDVQKNETGDLGSSEKLNLDRSSGDDFMEEDVIESKEMGIKADSDEVEAAKVEAPTVKDEGLVHNVDEDMPPEKVANVEDKNVPAAPSTKRKLNDQPTVRNNNDNGKRQRRWNSEGLKVSEPHSGDVVSTTSKNALQPALKRSFSGSDSQFSEEAPKERVVPPSPKPATNSLRIDHFLRPFTLKAVQELLGKTGTVTNFWMDHIKTHCFVSYSSVGEAVETRNAVYNLQWPPNGGRLLMAEFVDPQEVKLRVEAPPQSPATPVSSGAIVSRSVQPQPSPRPQVQKQQFPQPSLPPPPALSKPPTARERLLPPAREHLPPPSRENLPPVRERLTLPPPPPLPEKAADPPIVTLDDLFRKTKATPRIYYLPLSEGQVAAKVQAQGKTVMQ